MIGADILDQRKLLKLTQAEMAAAMGMSLRHYHRCESALEPVPDKIENLVKLAVSRAAAHQPKLDGRFKKPIDWKALGKVTFVYQFGLNREVGYDGARKDPSGRLRFKTEAELREWHKHWSIAAVEERPDGWHIALSGATIPPQ